MNLKSVAGKREGAANLRRGVFLQVRGRNIAAHSQIYEERNASEAEFVKLTTNGCFTGENSLGQLRYGGRRGLTL